MPTCSCGGTAQLQDLRFCLAQSDKASGSSTRHHAALFLVSDLAEWITGEALTVDGGEFMTFPMTGAARMRAFQEAKQARH